MVSGLRVRGPGPGPGPGSPDRLLPRTRGRVGRQPGPRVTWKSASGQDQLRRDPTARGALLTARVFPRKLRISGARHYLSRAVRFIHHPPLIPILPPTIMQSIEIFDPTRKKKKKKHRDLQIKDLLILDHVSFVSNLA